MDGTQASTVCLHCSTAQRTVARGIVHIQNGHILFCREFNKGCWSIILTNQLCCQLLDLWKPFYLLCVFVLSVSQWDRTGADKKLFLIHHEHTNPSLGSSLHNITSLPIMQSVSVYESHFHIMWKGTESAQLSDVPWKVTKLHFFLFSLKIWDRKFSFFILLILT